MEPKYNPVTHLSEVRFKKARNSASPYGPVQKGLTKSKNEESPELRQHIDEAIALGNSHREK